MVRFCINVNHFKKINYCLIIYLIILCIGIYCKAWAKREFKLTAKFAPKDYLDLSLFMACGDVGYDLIRFVVVYHHYNECIKDSWKFFFNLAFHLLLFELLVIKCLSFLFSFPELLYIFTLAAWVLVRITKISDNSW